MSLFLAYLYFCNASTYFVLDTNVIPTIQNCNNATGQTLVVPNLFSGNLKYINVHRLLFLISEMVTIIFPVGDKGPYTLHSQCHGCWWHSDARGSPEISRSQYKVEKYFQPTLIIRALLTSLIWSVICFAYFIYTQAHGDFILHIHAIGCGMPVVLVIFELGQIICLWWGIPKISLFRENAHNKIGVQDMAGSILNLHVFLTYPSQILVEGYARQLELFHPSQDNYPYRSLTEIYWPVSS